MGFFDRFRGKKTTSPPPEGDDLAIAEYAWAHGDGKHAAHHTGQVLQTDPESAGAWRLVRAMAEKYGVDAPDKYALLTDTPHASEVLLHAALQGEVGSIADAISYCVRVLELLPALRLDRWVERWTRTPRFAAVPVRELLPAILSAARSEHAGHAMQPTVVRMIAAIRVEHPDDPHLLMFHARLARFSGDLPMAEAIAREFHDRRPSYESAVALSGAVEEQGRLEDSLTALDDALRFAPDPSSRRAVLTDRGDAFLDLGKFDQAGESYEAALEIEPDHAWCLSSIAYLGAIEGDAVAAAQLRARAEARDTRALELIARFDAGIMGLPAPGSAVVNVIAQVFDKQPTAPTTPGGAIKISVSAPEPPAAILAMRAELARRGWTIDSPVTIKEVPTPDPRVPVSDVDVLLWRYDGADPHPAIDPPTTQVASAIAELAATPYAADEWWRRGQELGTTLGRERWRDVAAVMAHPPPPGPRFTWWDWWFRVDVAAAYVLAGLDAGWAGSRRRAALLALLRGPVDWSGTAAAIVMGQLAARDADLAGALMEELVGHFTQRPSFGDWPIGAAIDDAMVLVSETYAAQGLRT